MLASRQSTPTTTTGPGLALVHTAQLLSKWSSRNEAVNDRRRLGVAAASRRSRRRHVPHIIIVAAWVVLAGAITEEQAADVIVALACCCHESRVATPVVVIATPGLLVPHQAVINLGADLEQGEHHCLAAGPSVLDNRRVTVGPEPWACHARVPLLDIEPA